MRAGGHHAKRQSESNQSILQGMGILYSSSGMQGAMLEERLDKLDCQN